MQIAVVPGSNKTSRAAIRSLLSQDASIHIKAFYRRLETVPDEFSSVSNFTAVQGDVEDLSSLDFSGSDAVLMVLPPAYDGRDIVDHARHISTNIKAAVERAGSVKRLVLLSSMGAEFAEGVGELKTNHISEEVIKLTQIPEIIILRSAYFMENWSMSVDTLNGRDPFFFSTITPLDFRIHMIAVRDIGEAMAAQLTRDWAPPSKPFIMEPHWPEPYSPRDVQHAFSRALNTDVKIQAVEKVDLANFYSQIFAPQIVNEWVEMTTCFLPGGIAEKDLSRPSEVDVFRGKTTLEEALRTATAGLS